MADPKRKIDLLETVTTGLPVKNKEDGIKAAHEEDAKLKELYANAAELRAIAKQQQKIVAGLSMTNSAFNPEDLTSLNLSVKQKEALETQLNQMSQLAHNLKESAKSLLDAKKPQPAEPEKKSPGLGRSGS